LYEVGQDAADLPQRLSQGPPRAFLRPVGPEESDEYGARVGLLAMEQEVGKQRASGRQRGERQGVLPTPKGQRPEEVGVIAVR
jgi:hypothetical protein